MSDPIRMDKDDVTISVADVSCDDCEKPGTHHVWVDFRSAGYKQSVGVYCRPCAEEMKAAIQNGLPSPPEETS